MGTPESIIECLVLLLIYWMIVIGSVASSRGGTRKAKKGDPARRTHSAFFPNNAGKRKPLPLAYDV